ncbi:MAG: cytochrome c3 family protein [Thermodesulfobacteriota bacterium]|nr:cytochrome c3 family protein [Thermodesulfobacteriota bacterium]
MKKGLLALVVVALTGFIFITVGVLTAGDVPDDVIIQNEGYKKDKKGPVKLSHKKHSTEYKVACNECHHEYKEGKNIWKEGQPVRKCSECHNPLKKEDKVIKLQNAYHKNCKNCHKALIKDGKSTKAPFKKCNDCHQKKS